MGWGWGLGVGVGGLGRGGGGTIPNCGTAVRQTATGG